MTFDRLCNGTASLFRYGDGQHDFVFRVGALGDGTDAAELKSGQGLVDAV